MRLSVLNEEVYIPDHKDMLKSLFYDDNPIFSMALEPKEEFEDEDDEISYINQLIDAVGDIDNTAKYGQSSNYHRLNTYGNDEIDDQV